MTADSTTFFVDPDRVVHETIGDETIVIDLASGAYYSLTGAGPEIWALLSSGASRNEAALTMRTRYPQSPGEAEQGVFELAARLVDEGLLERDTASPAAGTSEAVLPPVSGAFVAPELSRYTDMQYYLLLDPVHEVDETVGWPAPHPGGGG
jgi:hypothetical protein